MGGAGAEEWAATEELFKHRDSSEERRQCWQIQTDEENKTGNNPLLSGIALVLVLYLQNINSK